MLKIWFDGAAYYLLAGHVLRQDGRLDAAGAVTDLQLLRNCTDRLCDNASNIKAALDALYGVLQPIQNYYDLLDITPLLHVGLHNLLSLYNIADVVEME